MVKLNVKIVSMQDADKFNKICSKFDCDMDLQSGKYYVDAKSILCQRHNKGLPPVGWKPFIYPKN